MLAPELAPLKIFTSPFLLFLFSLFYYRRIRITYKRWASLLTEVKDWYGNVCKTQLVGNFRSKHLLCWCFIFIFTLFYLLECERYLQFHHVIIKAQFLQKAAKVDSVSTKRPQMLKSSQQHGCFVDWDLIIFPN